MATRYFRKMGDSPVPLSNGQKVAFKSADGGATSFKAITDDFLASEFEKAMREGRSGLTEVDYATFDRDYLQKKSNAPTSSPPWREELVKGQVMPSASMLASRLQALPAAVEVSPPPAPVAAPPTALSQPAINAQIAKELPKASDYKPEVGKRRKKAA